MTWNPARTSRWSSTTSTEMSPAGAVTPVRLSATRAVCAAAAG